MPPVKFPTGSLESLYRRIPYFNRDRLASTSFSNTEYLSMLGIVYVAEIDLTILAGSQKWIRFVAPSDRDVQILKREMLPTITGAEYNLYFTASAFTDDGSNLIKIQTLNPLPGVISTATIKSCSAVTPTGNGFTLIRSGASASNSPQQQSSATNSTDEGLQTYGRGTGFYAAIKNTSTVDQRIVFRMTYAELDNSIIP